MEERPGLLPYANQSIELVFFGPEDGDPDNLPLLRLSAGGESQPFGDGWRVTERDSRSAFKRIAFEGEEGTTATNSPRAKAVEVLEGWALVFPLDHRLRAMIVVQRDVPVARWRPYLRRAEALYRWLRTKPAERPPTPGEL
jgi:hypothetical protein